MKNTEKTIPILTAELKEFRNMLKEAYMALGNKLLMDTVDPSSEKIAFSTNDIIKWQRVKDERLSCTQDILNIKNNNTRLEELKKFSHQIETSNKTLKKELQKNKTEFLFELYNNFSTHCSELFSSIDGSIKEDEDIIEKTKIEIEQLQSEKEKANIFSKIAFSHKISSKQAKIKKAKQKIKNILAQDITDIFSYSEIQNLYNDGKFTPEIKSNYESLLSMHHNLADAEERIKIIEEEKHLIENQLQELEASKNINKRISFLNSRIKEIDAEIDGITEAAGLSYTNQFYLDDGNLITEKNSDYTENYSESLEKISLLRKNINRTMYHIEFCKLNDKIKAEEAKITSLNKTIKNSEIEIKNAEKRIIDSKDKIKKSQDEIEKLKEAAGELLPKFSESDQ